MAAAAPAVPNDDAFPAALDLATTSLESLPLVVDDDWTDASSCAAQADAMEAWVELWEAAGRHSYPTPAQVKKVEWLWRRYFGVLSTVAPESPEVLDWSPTDVGFMALCRSSYMQPSKAVDVRHIGPAYAILSVLASQHTLQAREFWPPPKVWERIRWAVANVVDGLLVSDAPMRQRLLQELRDLPPTHMLQPGDLLQQGEAGGPSEAATKLGNQLLQHYEAYRVPDGVKLLLAKKKQEAERAIKRGEKDVRIEASEDASGVLWCRSTNEVVNNFVRVSSRVVWRIDFENWLAAQFVVRKAPRFTPETYERAHGWMKGRCSIEQTEELSALYRRTLYEACSPTGSESHHLRSKETREDTPTHLQVIECELGIDMAEYFNEYGLTKMATVAANPDTHIGWESLFLVLFQYLCRNSHPDELQLDWMGEYLVRRPTFRDWVERFRLPDWKMHNKRPVVVYLQRKWYLLYKRPPLHEEDMALPEVGRGALYPTCWLECDSLLHAAITWLHLVKRRFWGCTEQEDRLDGVYNEFLDANSLQVGQDEHAMHA